MRLSLGTSAGREVILNEAEKTTNTHVIVFGRTGLGKSNLLAGQALQLLFQGQGLTFIDPDDQTKNTIEENLAANWEKLPPLTRQNIYSVEFSPRQCASLDLSDIPGEGKERDIYKHDRAKRILAAMARGAGLGAINEQQRRIRVATNTIKICISLRKDGTTIGLQNLLEVLDSWGTRKFERIFNSVNHDLDVDTARDCWHINQLTKRDLENQTESCRNFFYNFLANPLIKQAVSNEYEAMGIRGIVRSGGAILAGLNQTDPDATAVLGSLLITLVSDAAFHEKKQHSVMVDEFHTVIGEDIVTRHLPQSRKRKLSWWLSVNSLSCLKMNDRDMSQDLLDMVGTHIFFQQRTETERIAKISGLPSLDFTERERPTSIPDGYKRVTTKSTGETESEGTSDGESGQEGGSESNGITEGETEGDSWREQWGQGKQKGESEQEGDSESEMVKEDGSEFSYGSNRSKGKQKSTSVNYSSGIGGNRSSSRNRSKTLLSSFSGGWSRGKTKGKSKTITVSEVYLAQSKTLWFKEGLETPLEVQYAKKEKVLRTLDVGEYLLCIGKLAAIVVKAHLLEDPWLGYDRLREYKTDELRKAIWESKPCFFVPREIEKWQKPAKKTESSSSNSIAPRRWEM